MSKLLYADLTDEKLRRSLGGGVFTWPALNSKSDLYFGLRFTRSNAIGGRIVHVVDQPIVREIRVTLGQVGIDVRPEAGSFTLKVGSGSPVLGTNLTSALDWDATATEIAAALNALSVVGTAAVVEDNASFLVTGVPDAISVVSNTLRPLTFVRVESYTVDGTLTQAIRLQRAPLAFTDQATQRVPAAPTITRVQAGGSDGDITWNEVQKLTVPIDFQGSYQIRSADAIQRTPLLGLADTPETISTAINPSADGTSLGVADDAEGVFVVTQHPTEPAVLIEFAGSMAGAGHDLLTVTVFDAPDGDYWITLPLDTTAMSEAFRDADRLTKVPLEIFVDVEDPDDDEIVRTLPVFRGEVTVNEGITHADLGTAANIDYLRPPAPKSYTPFSPTQVITGQRHYSTAAGNGSATTFVIAHNLASEEIDVRVRENASGGALLVHGTDYSVEITDDNSLEVTVLGSYASPAPTTGALIITVADLTAAATFAEDLEVELAQVNGLQAALDALSDRLTALEAQIGATSGAATATTGGQIEYPLTPLMIALRPTAGLPLEPTPLASLDILGAGLSYRRLAAAVHDAAVENLATTLPAAGSSYVGNAYVATAANTAFPGGGIRVGDFAICDGIRWLRASRYLGPTVAFTADASTDKLTSAAHGLANGDRVLLATTAADLPAPLAAGTVYYVVSSATNDFKLATTSGGSAINLTDAGTGTHYWQRVKDSFYPAEMETELFQVHVAPEELTLGSTLSLQFGIEAAIKFDADRRPRDRKTEASCRLLVEAGLVQSVTAPGTPGPNLSGIVWTTLLDSAVRLTPTPTPIRGGVTIVRSTANALTATRLIGRSSAAALAPNGGTGGVPFFLRGRIIDFDTNDSTPEPAGLVLIRGLDVGLDGRTDATLGRVTIG